jgi:hypothetical protein
MNRLSGWAVLVCLAPMLLIACTTKSPVLRDVQELKRRTVPSGGSLSSSTEPVLKDYCLRAAWEVQATSDTDSYLHWLRGQLGPEYLVTSETTSSVIFVKQLEGDSYTLHINSKRASQQGIVAEANFTACSD